MTDGLAEYYIHRAAAASGRSATQSAKPTTKANVESSDIFVIEMPNVAPDALAANRNRLVGHHLRARTGRPRNARIPSTTRKFGERPESDPKPPVSLLQSGPPKRWKRALLGQAGRFAVSTRVGISLR